MITNVVIKNYRSIVDATITLSPFTLLIGANGAGKSNFLRLLKELTTQDISHSRHINHPTSPQEIGIINDKGNNFTFIKNRRTQVLPELLKVGVFTIHSSMIGRGESLSPNPTVADNGQGAVQVLDALKTGDREDLFDKIESLLKEYIPEIEKLSFVPKQKEKILQVREKHIKNTILLSDLSEGTKLLLTILTIIFQENPPSLICIEEIDRGMHPRLFEKIIQLCFDITSRENMPQIIATTHNPYLVDQFKDNESAVIIVEKENGATTFTTLEEKLKNIGPDEEPLGSLWYSGFVGGVPQKAEDQ